MPLYIHAYGPEPTRNKDGDEIPEWTVYVGDHDAQPKFKIYRLLDLARARALARRMSEDRGLEIIDELYPA